MWRLLTVSAFLALLAIGYVIVGQYGILDNWSDGEFIRQSADGLGFAGPLLIIGLLAGAIVVSPVPSAPIALAAGAIYGHIWGTTYVVIGAELGALIAFGLSRWLGYQTVTKWLGQRISHTTLSRYLKSQGTLMAIVFASRLVPFLSFDIVSYAAGLTPLTTWRFAAATLLGIIPASFLLAHFGNEFASGDLKRVSITLLVLGSITLLPIGWKLLPTNRIPKLRRYLNRKD